MEGDEAGRESIGSYCRTQWGKTKPKKRRKRSGGPSFKAYQTGKERKPRKDSGNRNPHAKRKDASEKKSG